jgi:hypothetical protein
MHLFRKPSHLNLEDLPKVQRPHRETKAPRHFSEDYKILYECGFNKSPRSPASKRSKKANGTKHEGIQKKVQQGPLTRAQIRSQNQ